jgi:6-phosphogluconolactonase
MRLFTFALLLLSFQSFSQDHYLFIGTYTGSGSKGIYVYKFNTQTGNATWVSNTDSSTASNPSFLSVAPNGKYVYAVYEDGDQKNGHVAAYSFNKATGKLNFINKQLSGGDHPCYVATTSNNKWVAVANYTGGSAAIFAVNSDGSLKPHQQVMQHEGKSVVPQRQEKPHVHSTVFSPKEDYLFAPDLGTDKVMIYKFNSAATEPLQAKSFAASVPGSGPRHFTFHPNNKFAYLIEELSGTVAVYQYSNGKLVFLQRIATHPDDYKGAIGSADIHVSPDGKFLYASNRGEENTITIFSVNAATGKLKLTGYQSTMGKAPRNFMIDPTGNFLLVANQNTNNIVVFKRNKTTGLLTPTGTEIKVPKPVCLKMIK